MNLNELLDQLDKVNSHGEAIEIARELTRRFPQSDDAWHALYWNIGLNLSEAIDNERHLDQQNELINEMRDAWQHYMVLCPRDYNTVWNMAGFMMKAGQYSEAAEMFLRSAKLHKEYGSGDEDYLLHVAFDYYHAAACYRLKKDYERALECIDGAISTLELSDFCLLKAKILEDAGESLAAKEALSKADMLAQAQEDY
ncbi:MAG: hypothetical protein Q8J63_04995 [Candidatus Aquicultor sp.]|nr:hypothetical protein [Candidatus Aquicultor sp.]